MALKNVLVRGKIESESKSTLPWTACDSGENRKQKARFFLQKSLLICLGFLANSGWVLLNSTHSLPVFPPFGTAHPSRGN